MKNYDVDEDDDVYYEPSYEEWNAFLYDHEYFNHSLSIADRVKSIKK